LLKPTATLFTIPFYFGYALQPMKKIHGSLGYQMPCTLPSDSIGSHWKIIAVAIVEMEMKLVWKGQNKTFRIHNKRSDHVSGEVIL